VKDHTPAILRTYQYGDQIGTTGLAYIDQVLKPTKSPRVFNSLADAASALETHSNRTPSCWTLRMVSTMASSDQAKS